MAIRDSSEQNESHNTISVSVKGIPSNQGLALKEVSKARDVNMSTLLREMVNMTMGSPIHVFCVTSPIVASLDQDIVQFVGGYLMPAWNSVPMAPQYETAFRELLGIHNEDDLTKILLRNAQYLRMRASQVLPRGQQVYGGVSMHFALFCEIAGRDEKTIEAFWASVARFWGIGYRRQDYYHQINQLRGIQGLERAIGLSEVSAMGVYARAAIFQPDNSEKGLYQVLIALRTENTRALPSEAIERFTLPYCNGHILAPDPGYGAPVIFGNNNLGMGYRFKEDSCSLHLYSIEDSRIGETQTLSEVANALVDSIDENLRAYAATIPVNSR